MFACEIRRIVQAFHVAVFERVSNAMMIVQFRPYCQVWRLGPLDLTH